MGQQVLKGVEQINKIIGEHKFLLVKGRTYDLMPIKSDLDALPHAEFSDYTPNPLYEQVCRGVEVFEDESCDMIVAIGGGSAIDVAKCIKLFCKMNHKTNYLKQEKKDSHVPLIAIPTTAGTGSESTQHAVIYYEGKKQSVSHPSILPDFAILQPSVLRSLPVYQKKCTMLDALCQAIESWWSTNSTQESIGYSKKAISMIKEGWKEYIYDNTEKTADAIMEAANYAGRAINITATTAAHAMSYKITSLYGMPHGHAVAVCLPEVWSYMLQHTSECIDERGTFYLETILKEIEAMITVDDFRYMLDEMKIARPTAKDKEKELELLAKSVNPIRLKNNPIALEMKTLKDMYGRIVE